MIFQLIYKFIFYLRISEVTIMAALLKEIKSDRTEKVLELLQCSPDLNIVDKKTGNTPIFFAIENQNMTILKALFSFDAKPNLNLFNTENLSPLIYATTLNFTEAIELLLKNGADPNFMPEGTRAAIHWAAANNSKDAVKILLRHHANINLKCEEGTALHIATQENNEEIAFLLMENPHIDFLVTDQDGNSFLHTAIQLGSFNIFQTFFVKVENNLYPNLNLAELVNKANAEGNTIAHEAEINNRTSIAKFLKDNAEKFKIDLSKKNKDGYTAEELKKQIQLKAQEEEELKKLKKEEAKEIKKQKKIEMDKLNEERKIQEKLMKKKELELEEKTKEEIQRHQKLKPFIAVVIVGGVVVLMYVLLNIGIQNKKNNVLDL